MCLTRKNCPCSYLANKQHMSLPSILFELFYYLHNFHLRDCQCIKLVRSTVYDGTLWETKLKIFWSILTANCKLLVMPPYIVMSFVRFGLIENQIRQVAIKVTEALRLSVMKVSRLIGIGGLQWGNNTICNWGQQTKGSHLENFDGEQNRIFINDVMNNYCDPTERYLISHIFFPCELEIRLVLTLERTRNDSL